MINLCNRAGINPDIRQEAEGVTTILSLVAAGIGISIVSIAAAETQRDEIVHPENKGADDAIGLYLAGCLPPGETIRPSGESICPKPRQLKNALHQKSALRFIGGLFSSSGITPSGISTATSIRLPVAGHRRASPSAALDKMYKRFKLLVSGTIL